MHISKFQILHKRPDKNPTLLRNIYTDMWFWLFAYIQETYFSKKSYVVGTHDEAH